VPESKTVLGEDRMKEDMTFCEQFLISLYVGVIPQDVKTVYRLGPIARGEEERNPRPVLIHLGTAHIKNMIMQSLYKIKSMEIKYKNVIVAHDMTKKQREECKLLVQQAKEKTENALGTMYTKSGVDQGT